MKTLKFIVEKHRDCYVAYPLDLKGVVVAAAFHIESFGKEALEEDDIMEAFVTEASIGAG